jgi:hypothetical protein
LVQLLQLQVVVVELVEFPLQQQVVQVEVLREKTQPPEQPELQIRATLVETMCLQTEHLLVVVELVR